MQATKSSKNKSVTNNPQLKSALDGLGSFFGDLSNESYLGSDMINQNITTEFSVMLNEALTDPLKHTYGGFKAMEDVVSSIINDISITFFKANKKLIKKIVNPYKENKLFYVIVLKDDTTKNRSKLLSYVRLYSNTPYSQNFPVVFYFLPLQFESSLLVSEEITF
ncbi:MAG: hypothetical protein K8R85_05960 [Bacteroidetes bacterium]|nr:hypothetical protein [Bacteroidota bacterium]